MKQLNTAIAALLVFLSPHSSAAVFKTSKWTTPNGVSVVFYQAMEVPMLDISLAFAAGSAYDQKNYGLSALTSQMINQGNAGEDATSIAESLAERGAQFNSENSKDMVVFNLRTLTDNDALEQATQTFTQIIIQPDFPNEAFEREKKQMLMAIQQAQESPEDVANLHFFKTLYQDHPYAHPNIGTKETVDALERNQVIDFYKKYYVGRNSVLVLVGAINRKTAEHLADIITKGLPTGQTAAPVPKATPLTKTRRIHVKYPSSQTMIRLGQTGIDHQNPYYFPLMVGNYILGGSGLTSRLAIEVREKRGLTYGIDSQFVPMRGIGPFLITLSTKNKEAKNALQITEATLKKFVAEGPTKTELEAAKNYLKGSFPLSLSSNKIIASLLLRMAFYHLPDDYLATYLQHINAVTVEDIKKAFQEQVNPEKSVLIRVGQS